MGNCLPHRVKAGSHSNTSASIHTSINSSSGATSISPSTSASMSTSISTSMFTSTSTSTSTSQYLSTGSISTPKHGDLPRFSSSNCGSLHQFSYADLRTATKNFGYGGQLGEGGFGKVYKAYIDEQTFAPVKPGQGIVVAVKKLNLEGSQGHREWLTEVYFLGALHHPNLVKLLGYCAEDCHRLLVYEYVSRGSLENHLFSRRQSSRSISWHIRINVALGAARGLAFLHDDQTQVIYRDLKTANVLLDDNYNAKLSDFGYAKDGPTGDDTHVTTRLVGTQGYAAPEYLATGHLSPRSDVYSFGVVLLELLTGRRAIDLDRPPVEQKLVDWARPYLSDRVRVLRIIDQKLEGQYSLRGAHKIASLTLSCLSNESKSRPTMKEVVEVLESVVNKGSRLKHPEA